MQVIKCTHGLLLASTFLLTEPTISTANSALLPTLTISSRVLSGILSLCGSHENFMLGFFFGSTLMRHLCCAGHRMALVFSPVLMIILFVFSLCKSLWVGLYNLEVYGELGTVKCQFFWAIKEWSVHCKMCYFCPNYA